MKLPAKLHDVHFDLKDGYHPMSSGGPVIADQINKEQGIKHILNWIINNREKVRPAETDFMCGRAISADFLAPRGVFAKIMASPYDKNEGWCIAATRFKGTIYLYEFQTDKRRAWEMSRDEESNMISYGSLKFEKYVTEPLIREGGDDKHGGEAAVAKEQSDSPSKKKKDSMRFCVYHHDEYSCVVQSSIGGRILVYNSEVDCGKEGTSTILDFGILLNSKRPLPLILTDHSS
jgi:RAT1-interacting protein